MIVFGKTRQASSLRPRTGGFTLIELLAVIAILAILVVLVIGIGSKVITAGHINQTRQTMTQLLAACGAYYESYTEYPPDHDSTSSSGSATGWLNSVPPATDGNAAYKSGDGISVLYMYLTGKHFKDNTYVLLDNDLSNQPCVLASKPYLDKLPSTVWTATTHGFMDGFGTLMRYQCLGAKPLLISAGPDATFGTGDDIRSDGR
jgi:prepilin-type N-terminal cleavage/methylation domain-containing protein